MNKSSGKKIILVLKKSLRTLIQLFFFISAPGLFSSAFGAVKSLSSQLHKGQAIELTIAMETLLLLLIFTWLFGRVFCGMVCSFGFLGDLIFSFGNLIRSKLRIKALKLSQKIEKALSYLKYLVLLIIFIICFFGGQSFIHGKSPWDAFAQLISGSPKWKGYETGYIILLLIMIGMANLPRFFCRFLCPLGAIFSLLPPPPLSLRKPSGEGAGYRACGACRACTNNCPAGLELNNKEKPMNIVQSGECFRCMKCSQSCPQKKPSLTLFGKKMPVWPAMAVILLLFFAALLYLGLTRF